MDAFLQLLIDYGLWGMFVSAFLAGSVFPLSSEFVLAGLVGAGGHPLELLAAATVGNTLGSAVNYWIGSLGREEWIEHWLKIKPEQLRRGMHHVQRFGVWAGFVAWVPVLGELITVALGFARANVPLSLTTIFVGKLLRYWVIIAAMTGAMSLF